MCECIPKPPDIEMLLPPPPDPSLIWHLLSNDPADGDIETVDKCGLEEFVSTVNASYPFVTIDNSEISSYIPFIALIICGIFILFIILLILIIVVLRILRWRKLKRINRKISTESNSHYIIYDTIQSYSKNNNNNIYNARSNRDGFCVTNERTSMNNKKIMPMKISNSSSTTKQKVNFLLTTTSPPANHSSVTFYSTLPNVPNMNSLLNSLVQKNKHNSVNKTALKYGGSAQSSCEIERSPFSRKPPPSHRPPPPPTQFSSSSSNDDRTYESVEKNGMESGYGTGSPKNFFNALQSYERELQIHPVSTVCPIKRYHHSSSNGTIAQTMTYV